MTTIVGNVIGCKQQEQLWSVFGIKASYVDTNVSLAVERFCSSKPGHTSLVKYRKAREIF